MAIIKLYNDQTDQWEPIAVGQKGDTGAGVANGGITDQVLVKSSNTDFDTEWSSDLTINTLGLGTTIQQTNTATTSSTNAEILSTWSALTYSSSKAVITATSNSERQISELLITHNGVNAVATEYGVVTTANVLFTVDCSLVANDVVLEVTATSTEQTEYSIHENLFLL